jgi:hypothetical protein
MLPTTRLPSSERRRSPFRRLTPWWLLVCTVAIGCTTQYEVQVVNQHRLALDVQLIEQPAGGTFWVHKVATGNLPTTVNRQTMSVGDLGLKIRVGVAVGSQLSAVLSESSTVVNDGERVEITISESGQATTVVRPLPPSTE